MIEKDRVLVAMSGGIDSSVVAMMLNEQGYDIVGITLKTWDYAIAGHDTHETGCCSIDSINDARTIAVTLGFPHYTLDARDDFSFIIDNFVEEYMHGRTPNPCVLCNTYIKWDLLIQKANQLHCKYIATGHYAQILEEDGRFFVRKGVDEAKDQSYVLWGVSQENLSRTILPLGKYKKLEIRQMAKDYGFEELSKKGESYEICFIPDNNYRKFLMHRVPDMPERVGEGYFVDTNGKKLGKHNGYPFYTIGQRKGLNVAVGYPLFVVKIVAEKNEVVLGTREELLSTEMTLSKLNLQKWTNIPNGTEALVKVRYKDSGTKAKLYQNDDEIKVEFLNPVSAITPGQSAVIYIEDDVLAGGIIL